MTVHVIVQFRMIDRAACAGDKDSGLRGLLLPRRPKPEAEEERHRRGVGIRSIVVRPVVIIRPLIGTVGIMPVVPDATPRAEVGSLRCVGCVQAFCI